VGGEGGGDTTFCIRPGIELYREIKKKGGRRSRSSIFELKSSMREIVFKGRFKEGKENPGNTRTFNQASQKKRQNF